MSAAQRIAALDDLPARDLIAFTEGTLRALVTVMNEETTLLRSGRHREAGALGAEKTRLAQDYVTYSRAVQRQLERLKLEAPDDIGMLRTGHEQLATQMAENLKVIATAREVTEDILSDVATQVDRAVKPKTYGAAGQLNQPQAVSGGIAINRAL
jgi:flagellar biosynthesis/type III secretory pathway chaperone